MQAILYKGEMFNLVSTNSSLLGILLPNTIRIKRILQQVSELAKNCGEPLPTELNSNQQKVINSYFVMSAIKILR